jgi:hypothetical protein
MTRLIQKGGRFRLAACVLAGAVTLLTPAACENALRVTNPQNYSSEVLNNIRILQSVADGVEGLLQQAYDQTVVFTGLLSDELEDSSTWINWANMSLGRFGPGSLDDMSTQRNLLRARYAAADALRRFAVVLGDTGVAKSPLAAQVKTADAWIDTYLAMMYCESPLVANGPSAPDSAVYRQALTKFTDAITFTRTLPTSATNTAIVNWALSGRARVNLFLGNFDAALADAQAVPTGFVKQALFSTNSSTSFAGGQLNQNRNRSGTLRRIWWPMVDTSNVTQTPTPDQYVKDPWTNQNDTRMAVLHTRGLKGVNNSTTYYGIQKYKDYTSPETMTSKREMNLIAAEVYWRKGDLPNAITQLNINRTAAGLPAFTATGLTADDVFQRLLSERFATLFVEGHRLTDLNRFNLVTQRLGPGRALKYQLTPDEYLNNPSMKQGEQTCPGKS